DALAGIGAGQLAAGGNTANMDLTNSGAIGVGATANATGYDAAAGAVALLGAGQAALAVGTVDMSLVNNGTGTADGISVSAIGFADAGTGYSADATVIAGIGAAQAALFVGDASLSLENNASIAVVADASAIADTAAAFAGDEANAVALGLVGAAQVGLAAGDLELSLTNGTAGAISVAVEADASAEEQANAFAIAGVGLAQAGFGADVDISASNAGLIDVAATANASADEANAFALAGVGVIQAGIGGNTTAITLNTVDVSLTNASGGSIMVGALANATAEGPAVFGIEAEATAVAGAGVVQLAINTEDGDALATLNNSGV